MPCSYRNHFRDPSHFGFLLLGNTQKKILQRFETRFETKMMVKLKLLSNPMSLFRVTSQLPQPIQPEMLIREPEKESVLMY